MRFQQHDEPTIEELPLVRRLNKDLRDAAEHLTSSQARYITDTYYQIQRFRIRTGSQMAALLRQEEAEPTEMLQFFAGQLHVLEQSLQSALDVYSQSHPLGLWARSIVGIGPVLAGGLLAHIDISKAPTVGHIWRFAGLDPTVEWEREETRPWNADLKTLCWKAGESFVKMSNNPKDVYGRVYVERKALEQKRNEAGLLKDQAAKALAKFKFGKDTEVRKWYEKGLLPPAHIHARAKRYAVKLFLSHYHWVGHELMYGQPPPKPYVIEHLGHTHIIEPPNWPMETSLKTRRSLRKI